MQIGQSVDHERGKRLGRSDSSHADGLIDGAVAGEDAVLLVSPTYQFEFRIAVCWDERPVLGRSDVSGIEFNRRLPFQCLSETVFPMQSAAVPGGQFGQIGRSSRGPQFVQRRLIALYRFPGVGFAGGAREIIQIGVPRGCDSKLNSWNTAVPFRFAFRL